MEMAEKAAKSQKVEEAKPQIQVNQQVKDEQILNFKSQVVDESELEPYRKKKRSCPNGMVRILGMAFAAEVFSQMSVQSGNM